MFRKPLFKYLLAGFLLLVAFGGYYAYSEYTRRNPSMGDVKADYVIAAEQVLAVFESNADSAKKVYLNKVLEVSGPVKKIEKDSSGFYTVSLGIAESASSVQCSVDSLYTQQAAGLKVGVNATLRGECIQYRINNEGMDIDFDLGADLLLNRCYPKQ